ncbi:CDP-diacylglycerol--glycerol-3-phosphate 3-phosphatidyltransferase [Demequina muriae]|uniref:CDP-diacylglycerol--glycerol-3-phosphate 3-phosphatidyltransferase n=1 Tax=Demequina muriae TaxID=3051664 RepID=A0ABT8GE35_9MICO|nr:CDP-diacylglycerol--glycerol-3-phosphate 3-phosphatidyltransferase [Demequina sp. EGI L300058]MDN4479556.1 CDP-diacylglycerol--glycerol-3-phosphate 3-phosphatidyltransferase [Demequina sp. EGI L300058]
MNATVPNLLTGARLVAVPVVLWLLVADGGENGALRVWALIVFLVAAATDYWDGYLARRWEVVSPFGKLADPIADKALVLFTLVGIVMVDGIPWWPLAVLAFREIGVTVGRLAVARDAVIPASRGGKLKTVLQLLSLTAYLIPHSAAWIDAVAWWSLLIAVAVAVITGIDYAVRIARVARAHGEPTAQHTRASGSDDVPPRDVQP